MSHYVPDFEMEDDYTLPTSSNLIRSKKSVMPEDDIMELLWQNGQVVMQSQAQRSSVKKSPLLLPKYHDDVLHPEPSSREIRTEHHHHPPPHHLFMQEDEMASWLHYPLNDTNFDNDFCADLLYPSAAPCVTSATTTTTTNTNPKPTAAPPLPPHRQDARSHASVSAAAVAPRPPIPPGRRAEPVNNFSHFSRHRGRGGAGESGPSNSRPTAREVTVVDSSDTPAIGGSDSRISEAVGRSTVGTSSADNGCGTISGAAVAATTSDAIGGNREMTTCEITVTSSPGGSSASAELMPQKPPAEDRKRKGRDEDADCQSEDAEFESADAKKPARGSTSTKRSRAAEVHNLSERRRRDRINEKMRALQELIPRCNKSDKASMLDEAIEYLKSLQLQVQMMSMGCSMVPMMFPGIQQYMPPMGLGMGMGMGMGMEMGMNRPIMPFPNVMAGASLPTTAAAVAAHLGPRFPMPPFHMPPLSSPDPSRIQAVNQSDPMVSSLVAQSSNQPRVPNFADPYQQYLGLHQMQMSMPQSQVTAQPSTSKPSTTQGPENIENQQPGS